MFIFQPRVTKSSFNSTISERQVNLQKAIDMIKENGSTIRQVAEEFGVKKSTLHDHLSGKVALGSHKGPPRLLSEEEEQELYHFLVSCAKIGFAKSCKEILAIVSAALTNKSSSEFPIKVTYGWWSSFRKRFPDLTVRSATKLAYARAVAQDPEIFNHYFDILEVTL